MSRGCLSADEIPSRALSNHSIILKPLLISVTPPAGICPLPTPLFPTCLPPAEVTDHECPCPTLHSLLVDLNTDTRSMPACQIKQRKQTPGWSPSSSGGSEQIPENLVYFGLLARAVSRWSWGLLNKLVPGSTHTCKLYTLSISSSHEMLRKRRKQASRTRGF